MTKAAEAFRTISEVADELEIPKHVLRFWEVKFPQIRPMKRGGGRRYYRPQDMELLRGIQRLLHAEGYTIKGVQKILREQGVDSVKRPAAGEGAVIAQPQKTVPGSQLGQPLFDAGRPLSALRRGRAKSGGKAAEQTRTALIEAAIAELRLCRNILVAAPKPSASSARKPRQA